MSKQQSPTSATTTTTASGTVERRTLTCTYSVKGGVVQVDNKAGAVYADLAVARASKPADAKQVLRTVVIGGVPFYCYAVNGINNTERVAKALGASCEETDKASKVSEAQLEAFLATEAGKAWLAKQANKAS